MTSINLRPDDSGIQSLKKENTASPVERAVSALLPTSRAQPVSEYPPTPPQHQIPVYTGPERRRGERRKGQQPVILDTRDRRERRRNPQDSTEPQPEEIRGIDVYG